MKEKIVELIKFIYVVFVLFIIINIFVESPTSVAVGELITKTSDGTLKTVEATFLRVALTVAQISVSGWFTIKFTLVGIQYFTAQAASDKADLRKKLRNTLILGVLAVLSMFLFGYAVGI